jgi:MoaF N-terminal domain
MKTNPIMTRAQVDAAVAQNKTVFAQSAMAGNKGPVSSFLTGKALTLRYDDGTAIDYRFDEIQKLRWRRAGDSAWREERYESWESAPGAIMFGHLLSGAADHDAMSIVVDFDNALVTCLHGTMGTPYIGNEAAVKTLFGVVEMQGLTPPKIPAAPVHRRARRPGDDVELFAGPDLDAPVFHAAFVVVDHLSREWLRRHGMERPRVVREDSRSVVSRLLARGSVQRHARDDPDQHADDEELRRGLQRRAEGVAAGRSRRALTPRRTLRCVEVLQAAIRRGGVMATKVASTRRSFIRKTGAALSMPLAAAAATGSVSAAPDDPAASRIARLEDLEAIRALSQAFARQVNAGDAGSLGIDASIRNISAHEFGARDVIEILPDGLSAKSLMHCIVEIETAISPSCPLVEMAREQGGGVVKRSETGVFENTYDKRDGIWTIERATYRPA